MECVSQRNLQPVGPEPEAKAGPGAAQLPAGLADLAGFWEHWGFEPWRQGPFAGVSRRQRFVKSGLLGPVAEYEAWEAVVWQSGSQEERQRLWRGLAPRPNIMTQRFLFLLAEPSAERKIRSFCLGFRGYVEFYFYWPGRAGNPKAADLTGLVDLALKIAAKRDLGGINDTCEGAGS